MLVKQYVQVLTSHGGRLSSLGRDSELPVARSARCHERTPPAALRRREVHQLTIVHRDARVDELDGVASAIIFRARLDSEITHARRDGC